MDEVRRRTGCINITVEELKIAIRLAQAEALTDAADAIERDNDTTNDVTADWLRARANSLRTTK